MLKPVPSSRFKKNYKLLKKRGYDMSKLDYPIKEYLLKGKPLPPVYLDHKLSGNWKDYRECHITPDWLLIYKIDKDKLLLSKSFMRLS